MDAEAPGNVSDVSGNPEVAWWCKILTRLVASIAGVGESFNFWELILLIEMTVATGQYATRWKVRAYDKIDKFKCEFIYNYDFATY